MLMFCFVKPPDLTFRFDKNVLSIPSFLKSINCVPNVVLWTRNTVMNKALSLFSISSPSSRSEAVSKFPHGVSAVAEQHASLYRTSQLHNWLYNLVQLALIKIMVFTMHTQWPHLCYLISSSSITPSQENILLGKKKPERSNPFLSSLYNKRTPGISQKINFGTERKRFMTNSDISWDTP